MRLCFWPWPISIQRIDAVCSHADVQHRHGATASNARWALTPEQIRKVVEVVAAAGNRRAQETRGNIPGLYAIGVLQQSLIEDFHRLGIREVDGLIPVGVLASVAQLNLWQCHFLHCN